MQNRRDFITRTSGVFNALGPQTAGYSRFDITPELKAGLTLRPTEITAKETLDWFRTLPADRQTRITAGLAPDREAQVRAAWKARGVAR